MDPVEARKQVVSAIEVLKDLNEKYNQSDKKKLLLDDSQDGPVFLTVSLKKIPSKQLKKDIKINLPHCYLSEKSDICLIAGDSDKNNRKAEIEPDNQAIKLLLTEKDVKNVSEVVTLRQLRTEYKEFSTKIQLVNAHDVFLCDKLIAECLPRLLGKTFFKRNKFPLQVDLKVKNLKEEINKKLSTVVFPLNCNGNSCSARVARLGMLPSDIADNVVASLKVLSDAIPGGWDNVKGVHMKLQKSAAIPIFLSLNSASDVKLPEPKRQRTSVMGELSTLLYDDEVRVHSDGTVSVLSNKERIPFKKNSIKKKSPFAGGSKKKNPFAVQMKKRKVKRFGKIPKKEGEDIIGNGKDGEFEGKLNENEVGNKRKFDVGDAGGEDGRYSGVEKKRSKKEKVASNDESVADGHSGVGEKGGNTAKVASNDKSVADGHRGVGEKGASKAKVASKFIRRKKEKKNRENVENLESLSKRTDKEDGKKEMKKDETKKEVKKGKKKNDVKEVNSSKYNKKSKGRKRKHQDSKNVEKERSAKIEKEPQSKNNIKDGVTKENKKIPIHEEKKHAKAVPFKRINFITGGFNT